MKLRQEDFGFKAILGYIARPCLKKKKIYHKEIFKLLADV
jgi:hypothetical protein